MRHVRLRTPPVAAVAELLHRQDGVEEAMALYAARAAQSHVGLARRLARDEGARIRRRDVIALAAGIHSVGAAVGAAADLVGIADEERESALAERNSRERARLLETLGADASARAQPPHVRAQVASLEREQKTRATRLTRDIVDRALVDLLSVFRDALVVHAGADSGLVNQDSAALVHEVVRQRSAEQVLLAMDAIGLARERISGNVPPLLALEAMAVSLQVPR